MIMCCSEVLRSAELFLMAKYVKGDFKVRLTLASTLEIIPWWERGWLENMASS